MIIQCGVSDDDGVSPSLKCHINYQSGEDTIGIYGYIATGSSVSLNAQYTNPFDDLFGQLGRYADAAQFAANAAKAVGFGVKTEFNTISVFEGADGIEFSLSLYFHAYVDAEKEVNDPLKYLSRLLSPDYTLESVNDRLPAIATLDLGRKLKVQAALIDMQYDLDAPITSNGFYANQTVMLTFKTLKGVNKRMIDEIYI